MMSRREASRIARRMTAGVALAVTLAACGSSRLDGVPVDWPGFREPRLPMAPSDPAQCPDLAGPYRIQGEFRTGERDASLDDLGRFLAWTLYLPGMGQGEARAWNPAPGASVAFASDAQAWRRCCGTDAAASWRAGYLMPRRPPTAWLTRRAAR